MIEPVNRGAPRGMQAQHYAVIDFETTGLSPAHGARPTEIAVVRVRSGQIVDRFQSLMNPGVPIPWDIQQFTGITDAMVLLARRLVPGVANYKLATLVRALELPSAGRYHRALADAECTAHLFIRLQDEVRRVYGVEDCDCGLLEAMQRASRKQLGRCVERYLTTMG